MDRHTFDRLLRGSVVVGAPAGPGEGEAPEVWRVAVRQPALAVWLERYGTAIDDTAGRVAGRPIRVVFERASAGRERSGGHEQEAARDRPPCTPARWASRAA